MDDETQLQKYYHLISIIRVLLNNFNRKATFEICMSLEK